MLTINSPGFNRPPHTKQKGVVLVIALIVLVAMTLAALSLMRSVDTTNIIAGNLAFRQAAVHSGDNGVEAAIAWLTPLNNTVTLEQDVGGYFAGGSSALRNPANGQSWDAYWNANLSAVAVPLVADASGNTVSYVIDRMCNNTGSKTGGASCIASPIVNAATGNSEESNEVQLNAVSVVYYRITVRIDGPRNTVSYIQAVISM